MGSMVEIRERKGVVEALNRDLTIEPRCTAVVTIDMKRLYLDPAVGHSPLPKEVSASVVSSSVRLLGLARRLGMPVVHVVLQNRGVVGASRPFYDALYKLGEGISPGSRIKGRPSSFTGSPQVDLMPELGPMPGDFVVDCKRRFSAFYGTDLEILLRELRVDTVILIGINTNTCVQCSVFEAINRDLKPIVVSDCVASTYGDDLHILALENIKRCLGWVLTLQELEQKLSVAAPAAAPHG